MATSIKVIESFNTMQTAQEARSFTNNEGKKVEIAARPAGEIINVLGEINDGSNQRIMFTLPFGYTKPPKEGDVLTISCTNLKYLDVHWKIKDVLRHQDVKGK